MESVLPQMPERLETVAELRQLYRDAEARAARLRLLSRNGRDLAEVDASSLEKVLGQVALRLAHFLGQRSGHVSLRKELTQGEGSLGGLPIPSPGDRNRVFGHVLLEGIKDLNEIFDMEDRQVVELQLEQIGLALHRIERDLEQKRLTTALIEREQRLEYVVNRLFTAQEEERRRVSHELHDGVAQTATALVRMLEGATSENKRLAEIARGLVRELRSVIGDLRPPQLDDLGLEAALRTLVDELRDGGYDVDLQITTGPLRWSANAETAMYRVAQEALNNIRKHAGGPCRVEVSLSCASEGRPHCLAIRDHGLGCAPQARRNGELRGTAVGIDVMRERMAAIGGNLHWVSAAGEGVTVTAELPMEAA